MVFQVTIVWSTTKRTFSKQIEKRNTFCYLNLFSSFCYSLHFPVIYKAIYVPVPMYEYTSILHLLYRKFRWLKIVDTHLVFLQTKINDKLTPPVLCDEKPIYEYRMNQVVFSTKLYLACLPNGFSRFFAFILCRLGKNGSLSFYDKIILSKI